MGKSEKTMWPSINDDGLIKIDKITDPCDNRQVISYQTRVVNSIISILNEYQGRSLSEYELASVGFWQHQLDEAKHTLTALRAKRFYEWGGKECVKYKLKRTEAIEHTNGIVCITQSITSGSFNGYAVVDRRKKFVWPEMPWAKQKIVLVDGVKINGKTVVKVQSYRVRMCPI